MHGESDVGSASPLDSNVTKLSRPSGIAYRGNSHADHTFEETVLLSFTHTFADIYVASKLFVTKLVTLESMMVAAISVGTTLFYCYYRYDGHALAVNLNWQLFAFAVVFPLTFNMNEAFKRREQALHQFAVVKSNMVSTYLAHRDWDWATKQVPHGGRAALPKGHVTEVREVLRELSNAMSELLMSPMVGRARHQATAAGLRKWRTVQERKRTVNARAFLAFNRLSAATEEMKTAGLPGNEAARIRQYNTNMWTAWESMRIMKRYRTPLSTRAYSRLYIWVHPFIMGPYYSYVAGAGPVTATNIGFACSLAAITSVALCGLFNARYSMEDPYDHNSPDCVDVVKEFSELHGMLGAVAAGPPLFDNDAMEPCQRLPNSTLSQLRVHDCFFVASSRSPLGSDTAVTCRGEKRGGAQTRRMSGTSSTAAVGAGVDRHGTGREGGIGWSLGASAAEDHPPPSQDGAGGTVLSAVV